MVMPEAPAAMGIPKAPAAMRPGMAVEMPRAPPMTGIPGTPAAMRPGMAAGTSGTPGAIRRRRVRGRGWPWRGPSWSMEGHEDRDPRLPRQLPRRPCVSKALRQFPPGPAAPVESPRSDARTAEKAYDVRHRRRGDDGVRPSRADDAAHDVLEAARRRVRPSRGRTTHLVEFRRAVRSARIAGFGIPRPEGAPVEGPGIDESNIHYCPARVSSRPHDGNQGHGLALP